MFYCKFKNKWPVCLDKRYKSFINQFFDVNIARKTLPGRINKIFQGVEEISKSRINHFFCLTSVKFSSQNHSKITLNSSLVGKNPVKF